MPEFKLTNAADLALSKLQNTTLNPMEEALFQAWSKANHILKPDNPDDTVDYRGIYKATGGTILPNGQLKHMAEKFNAQNKLEQVLQDRMLDHIEQVKQKHLSNINAMKPEEPSNGRTE